MPCMSATPPLTNDTPPASGTLLNEPDLLLLALRSGLSLHLLDDNVLLFQAKSMQLSLCMMHDWPETQSQHNITTFM